MKIFRFWFFTFKVKIQNLIYGNICLGRSLQYYMFHSSILRRMECARNACSAHHISINDSVEIYVVFYQGLHSAVHQCVVFKTTNVLCKPTLSSICYMCRPDRQPALSVDFIVPAVLVVRF